MPAPPLALSLLHNLLRESLGHSLPLPHVSRFRWYVFGSTSDDDARQR